MKFQFKIQQYQTDAVENTVNVFTGQPSKDPFLYTRDLGKIKKPKKGEWVQQDAFKKKEEEDPTGYRNQDVELTEKQLLDNIQRMQVSGDIKKSPRLLVDDGMGACQLDIEMETGTGKTYVYIKTMFELNRRYGWTKFIVVVPSIAIREGVYKSFETLEEHFMEYYQKKARFFIYKSSELDKLDDFSRDSGINVMIINSQAFAKDMKKVEIDPVTGKPKGTKSSLIIYDERDEFQSRRPIDVISANRPIIIMDEPQKMEGKATQNGLKNFKPLFVLNYSATHKTSHNSVYALDALDAYKQKLVKKIAVKGFDIKNLRGTNGYMYLDSIILSKNKPPMVKLEIEVKRKSGEIHRQRVTLGHGDDLWTASNELNQYEGYVISDISPERNLVEFRNGEILRKGEVVGDSNEAYLQRLQIRETIKSHFKKERSLFLRGIKCLSLFFIDEVANYKTIQNGEEVPGYLWKVFEDEYKKELESQIDVFEPEYSAYLRRDKVEDIHRGYFSIDKKTGHAINGKSDKNGMSDDTTAYELILKNKEQLLSFKEPTRFIFSHSALREGWDNPNVFQICTLRHANSTTAKRQEVGRGLRLCVDQYGNRMDYETLGDDIHEVNRLTVIANESYADFTAGLQADTKEALRERPKVVSVDLFKGRIVAVNDEPHTITETEAASIFAYFYDNMYIDEKGNVTENYHVALSSNTLPPMPPHYQSYAEDLHTLVQSTFDESKQFKDYIDNDDATTVDVNALNENFAKKEFQNLWKRINHKYAYTVHYDSNELITNVVNAVNEKLYVTKLTYIVTEGEQSSVDEFTETKKTHKQETDVCTSNVAYDLVGDIARGAHLTRKTVVEILKRTSNKLIYFRNNPEEYIREMIKIINEQKATMIVESIGYSMIDDEYKTDIFTVKKEKDIAEVMKVDKHITDYIFLDSDKEKEIAKDMDIASEVAVYAKLPRSFKIPTPVGNYAPDWAIAFHDGSVKHIFFVAETKGTMETLQLKPIEQAKIKCARKLFNEISTENVRYHDVSSYQKLLDVMNKLK